MASQAHPVSWLAEHGPVELERLFRAIVFHPSTPLLLTDSERRSQEASTGASRLLGLPREKIVGRPLEDFAAPDSDPVISERWSSFLKEGEQDGTLALVGTGGTPLEVEYSAKGSVLPARHLLALREKSAAKDTGAAPAWVQDYALFLLDTDGKIFAWYAGAERIYGHQSGDVLGEDVSLLCSGEGVVRTSREQLKRAASEGHVGTKAGT